MSLWDRIAGIQNLFWNKDSNNSPVPIYTKHGYVNYGVARDIAINLPANPASFALATDEGKELLNNSTTNPGWNQSVEKARQTALSGLGAASQNPVTAIGGGAAVGYVLGPGGAAVGAGIGGTIYSIGALDAATNGKLGNALMSPTKGVRSNYAFVREATNANVSLGLLAGLSQIGGAIAGGLAAVGAGAVAGSVVPGFGTAIGGIAAAGAVLGFYGGGKVIREVSESGALGGELQKAAVFSQSVQGQEKYNIGRDVTKSAGYVSGWKPLQNTDTGIGAVASGLVNIFVEIPSDPSIKGVQIVGRSARAATVGGISAAKQGIVGGKLQSILDTPEKIQLRLNKDVDLLKRTAAGEKTPYTPMVEFISKSDASTVKLRTEFALGDETSHVAAALMAGKSPSEITLLLRIGRGDATAIDELAFKHKGTYAQLIRAESKLNKAEMENIGFKTDNKLLKKAYKDKEKILAGELDELRGKYASLDKALSLNSALQERTVSVFPFIERARNDVAMQKAANKLGINKSDLTQRETGFGKITQRVFQDNTFGAVVRLVERFTDDAPHSTVNFNDPIQSTGRVRTTIRAGVQRNLFKKDEVVDLYNKFINSRFEADKLRYVEDFTKTVFERLAIKHGIPESSKDMVLSEYLYRMRKNQQLAKQAKVEGKAYMIDNGEIVADPVLISQLANGSYLPDVILLDNAFKQFRNRANKDFGGLISTATTAKFLLDEYNSIWRNFTLARVGYPLNILRDNTLRVAADGQWFNVVKSFSKETMDDFSNFGNTVGKIKRWTKGVTDKNYSLKSVRKELDDRVKLLADAEKNVPSPLPKRIKPELQRSIEYRNDIKRHVELLQLKEKELVSKIPTPRVGRKPTVISDYSFTNWRSGMYGRMTMDKIRGRDDIRGLLESNRELQLAEIRRDRTGGTWVQPTLANESLHLKSWENILTNVLPSDVVAMKIMQGVPKAKVLKFIKSEEIGTYIDRFAYDATKKRALRRTDAEYIYDRVLKAVNQFAPDIKLQKLIVEGKVNATELKKMYPDVLSRPGVNSDMAIDLLGQSNFIKTMNQYTRDVVAWLATAPPSKLGYNPYYRNAYEQKLQSMVAVANAQGKKLSEMDQKVFEANARAYALKEVKTKLFAFSKDMNYPKFFDYTFAFFPALVEQYRVYGRLFIDNPEFPLKAAQMMAIPDRLADIKVDANGEEYVEVTLPLLGDNVKGRLSTTWFNPYNPTGGTILSVSPWVSTISNEILKKSNAELPSYFKEIISPFGVQANSFTALTPTTVRRGGQALVAYVNENSNQLNRDVAMIMENKLFQFKEENGRQPTPDELTSIYEETERDGKFLITLRFFGSGLLPLQPRYVSPLQVYSDLLRKYQEDFGGSDGTQKFIEDYPEYFLVMNKITDSVSGIYPDKTSQLLVKNNTGIVKRMIARMGTDGDLRTLGAVFNDENYAFSSSAQAWLQTNTIPGTRKQFVDSQSALENARSAIVNEGWRNWTLLIDTTSRLLLQNDPPYDPSRGYGKAILDSYKEAFIEKMKTDNKTWYDEKMDRDSTSKLKNVVDNLSLAANDDKLWADLSKQARWHTIVEYLNFRYYIKEKLEKRNATITSDRAYDIREEVDTYVFNLRRDDINFGKFYDRYFSNDNFVYVAD
jgi:hypothetical protein